MDEDIAQIATDLKTDIRHLTIKIKIYTTFDPCMVCKRDLIIRKQLYKHTRTEIEVFRPFYLDISGVRTVVKDSNDFEKFYLKKK